MKLEEIEGIGPSYAAKLAEHGLQTTDHLLEQGATAAGREALAAKSGISGKLLLEWVNHADLCRIDGVGGEYADLLEAAGVDTVVELGTRNASNLAATLARVNEEKKLVRRAPTETEVARLGRASERSAASRPSLIPVPRNGCTRPRRWTTPPENLVSSRTSFGWGRSAATARRGRERHRSLPAHAYAENRSTARDSPLRRLAPRGACV